ncbi:ferritin [Saccharomonospora glauca]|jgi:ferritin|uniref:Ferritin n=1 Tax=Saccharomonospora glauca K62 TaxID=928724 RepID=I1CWP2_9PSEU|nr:ferritin [Saccharomonospora glauca]EIE97116.1 ferritin-like protein [Saccharomonospora glauca K62]
MASFKKTPQSRFYELLQAQIRNEFHASQQYLATAVWFDGSDLPRLAAHFYRQSLEERNHAMALVQYLLDTDHHVEIPEVPRVRNDFSDIREPIALALDQEIGVENDFKQLAKAARDEEDYTGEQFVQWFLKEQVEEISSMRRLLNVVDMAKGDVFSVEQFLARESVGDENDPTMPPVAGGKL